MFMVYYSNHLNVLKRLIGAIIAREPLVDPFRKEIILVESSSMEQWLQMQLAEQFGIAANINYILPATFIWQMFTHVLSNIPKESTFNKDCMTWKVMWLLPELLTVPAFASLQYYLTEDSDKRKIYQLAGRIACLFERYLIYRPKWLETWQYGKYVDSLDETQQWQALLWARLVEYTRELGQPEWDRTNLHSLFITTINNAKYCLHRLPQRVFICGISTLPPVYLEVLQALGRHIDIHLMFTNPCRYYWGAIQDHTFLTRSQSRKCDYYNPTQEHNLSRQSYKAEYLFNNTRQQQPSNPLLASWGKLGCDYLYLLSQLEEVQEINAFVNIPDNNILHAIQHDILELEDHTVIGITSEEVDHNFTKRLLDTNDSSFRLHLCHSQLREVEVLHDQLLTMLEEDPELTLRDIIVMIPNIDSYIPYIQSVFGNASAKCYLPFSIPDRKVRQTNPALQAFISLLDLPQIRFTAEQVLSLLEVPELAARFAINNEELLLLRSWVSDSGVRWGLDDNNVRDQDLPATGKYTWRFGVMRMLLGYAMDSEAGDWHGILPYDESSGLAAELVGKLADLLNSLGFWRQELTKIRSLEEWLPLCHQLLDAFFMYNAETTVVLELIEQRWQQVIRAGVTARYPNAVPLSMLRDNLVPYLEREYISQHYLSGRINFCTMISMRSIPFKVVCLLGMNNGIYPRTAPLLSFDLMAKHPKCGDRSQRDDDRYLFLEAILAAQQRLYISCIGRSIQDNREHHPSVLVTELLEYIEQNYCLPGDEDLDPNVSAKRVSKHLLKWHPRMPFAAENFLPGSEQQSYAAEWLPAADGRGTVLPSFNHTLLPVVEQQITLDDLRRFYRHPIRAFFQLRLGVSFTIKESELPGEEPFTINSLKRYELNSKLLNSLIKGEQPIHVFQQAYAAGELPFGPFGEIYWQQQQEDMMQLAKKVRSERATDNSLELDVKINGVTISGWLHQVQSNGLLRWRPAVLSIVDGIQLWLEHLVYCCSGGAGISRIYGSKSTTWSFESLMQEDAKNYLGELIAGYQRGMCQPLFLLNKCGWAWLSQCYQPDTHSINWQDKIQTKARAKLLQSWRGNQRILGEREDPYVLRVFRKLDLNNKEVVQILAEAERYLLPVARYNIG